jgi:hypothetical protein
MLAQNETTTAKFYTNFSSGLGDLNVGGLLCLSVVFMFIR